MLTNEHSRPRSIYTDGAAPNNQTECLAGGIGVAVYDASGELLVTYKERIEVQDQAPAKVTNIRCEMLALIKGLEIANNGDTIHSDSEMIVKGYNEWLEGWKRKGWKNASKKPVANQDLWLCIDQLKQSKPEVLVQWVRGHDGIEGNELADTLASMATD